MSNMTGSSQSFSLNRQVIYFIICVLGMVSIVNFWWITSSCAATEEDDDKTDFGLFMPAKVAVETTIADALKNQTTLGMTRWDVSDEELWCIVTDGSKFFSGRWLPSRHLRFYKKVEDKLILEYEYETMDRFSSFYSMEELGGRLLTVWDGGNSRHFVIFAVVGKTLKVVLMTGSKALPEIVYPDNDGTAEILIWGRSYEVVANAEKNIQSVKWQVASIYKWDDNRYVLVKTVPWLSRLNALQKPSQ
jgi:hypothetical protein